MPLTVCVLGFKVCIDRVCIEGDWDLLYVRVLYWIELDIDVRLV